MVVTITMVKTLFIYRGLPGSGVTTALKAHADSISSQKTKLIITANKLDTYDKPTNVTHAIYNKQFQSSVSSKLKWHTVKALTQGYEYIFLDYGTMYGQDYTMLRSLFEYAKLDNYKVATGFPKGDTWERCVKVLNNKAAAFEDDSINELTKELFKQQVDTKYNRVWIYALIMQFKLDITLHI